MDPDGADRDADRSTTATRRSARDASRPSSAPSRSPVGALRRPARRRAGHRRLPGRAAVPVHRRHDQPGRGRRQRRAVPRPRARSRADADARVDGRRRHGRGRTAGVLERHADTTQAIVDFVEPRRPGGRRALRPARRADRGLRQRRHAVVREADADRARLHPAAARRDGRAGSESLRDTAAVEGRPRQGLRLARRRDHQALPRRRQRREGADGRHPAGVRRR